MAAAGAVTPLRVFAVGGDAPTELDGLPDALPAQGFLWVACHQAALDGGLAPLQAALHRWCGGALMDLHVSDLRNTALPSRHEDTSWYDLLVFRRLAAAPAADAATVPRAAAGALQAVDTTPTALCASTSRSACSAPAASPTRAWLAASPPARPT